MVVGPRFPRHKPGIEPSLRPHSLRAQRAKPGSVSIRPRRVVKEIILIETASHSVTFAIGRANYRYHFPAASIVDQVVWRYDRGWPGAALNWAKGCASRFEKLDIPAEHAHIPEEPTDD